MSIIGDNERADDQDEGRPCSDTCPADAWIVELKGDSDDCLSIHKIVIGSQASVADWIGSFLRDRLETIERLAGAPIEIKMRATTVDTVQGIASTIDGLAYVKVRAMQFSVEVL
ncbi:MAG: hypothetical protein ACRYG8_24515 [Janthinobacterium lividum]